MCVDIVHIHRWSDLVNLVTYIHTYAHNIVVELLLNPDSGHFGKINFGKMPNTGAFYTLYCIETIAMLLFILAI